MRNSAANNTNNTNNTDNSGRQTDWTLAGPDGRQCNPADTPPDDGLAGIGGRRPGTPPPEARPGLHTHGGLAGNGKRKTRGKLTIATLNVKGFKESRQGAGVAAGTMETDKWQGLQQLMRERRIAVLAVQETHQTMGL